MKIHLISGFLGSGKTTAIQQGTRLLKEQGTRAGVITNDQGSKLVDGALFNRLSVPNREVINGCFCCNYHELETGIESLINADNAELIFAESVGSCTDIVATVLKPLLQCRPKASVTLSVFADARLLQIILDGSGSFDERVRYIYTKQLEEAGIIVVSKIDLITQEELLAIEKQMQIRYPSKKLIFQNSFRDKSILNWLTALNTFVPAQKLSSLNIDYDHYAAGEAKMAWLDQSIEIFDTAGMAVQVGQTIINSIFSKVKDQQLAIGHLKFMVDNAVKISFTYCDEATIVLPERPANHISVLINMRVETAPSILQLIVDNAIEEARIASCCGIIVSSQSAFRPGYPSPVFRYEPGNL